MYHEREDFGAGASNVSVWLTSRVGEARLNQGVWFTSRPGEPRVWFTCRVGEPSVCLTSGLGEPKFGSPAQVGVPLGRSHVLSSMIFTSQNACRLFWAHMPQVKQEFGSPAGLVNQEFGSPVGLVNQEFGSPAVLSAVDGRGLRQRRTP